MSRQDYFWIKCMDLGAAWGCHQIPERSFVYKGYQFPICARCTGVFISTIFAYIVYNKKRFPLWINLIMATSMVIDASIQYMKIKESNNLRRFITGCLGGFGITTIRIYIYIFLLKITRSVYRTIKI